MENERPITVVEGILPSYPNDANIASTMLAHGVSRLVTLNPEDFALFSDLEMVDATIQPHLAQ